MLTTLVQDHIRFYTVGLRPGQDHYHLTKATLKFPAVVDYLNQCVASRVKRNWTSIVVKTGHLTSNDDASKEIHRCTTTWGGQQ